MDATDVEGMRGDAASSQVSWERGRDARAPRRGCYPGCEQVRANDCRVMVIEKLIRYAGLAVGLMVFETFIRYAGLAVGLKPSATECEARLRGLERSMYSKTISPRLWDAKPACAG